MTTIEVGTGAGGLIVGVAASAAAYGIRALIALFHKKRPTPASKPAAPAK